MSAFVRKLREAVEASIYLVLAEREEGADGHTSAPHREREIADAAWAEVEKRIHVAPYEGDPR